MMHVQKGQEKEIVFLLKTMRKEFLNDSMTKGRFCFNHPIVFSQWEDNNAAQYDRWEAHSSFEATNLVIAPQIGENDGKPVFGPGEKLDGKVVIHMQSDMVKYSPICCFRYVDRNEVIWQENSIIYSLGETAQRIINEFRHDAFVLVEASKFLERLKRKVGRLMAMDVAYCDTQNIHAIRVPEQYQWIVGQLFRKDKKYEWQKEFRIVLEPTETSPVFVEIGSIEDIAICGNVIDLIH